MRRLDRGRQRWEGCEGNMRPSGAVWVSRACDDRLAFKGVAEVSQLSVPWPAVMIGPARAHGLLTDHEGKGFDTGYQARGHNGKRIELANWR